MNGVVQFHWRLTFCPSSDPLRPTCLPPALIPGMASPWQTYGGHLAAEMVLKKPKKSYLIERKVFTIPPEPIRFLVAKILIKIFSMVDFFSDRKIKP